MSQRLGRYECIVDHSGVDGQIFAVHHDGDVPRAACDRS